MSPLPFLKQLGVTAPMAFSGAAVSILLILEFIQRDKGYALDVETRSMPMRWATYAGVIALIVCFRYTGSALDFIYFQF
jgi:hypothetical protein